MDVMDEARPLGLYFRGSSCSASTSCSLRFGGRARIDMAQRDVRDREWYQEQQGKPITTEEGGTGRRGI